MKLSVTEAARAADVLGVIVHSHDRCVYTASVRVAGGECILTDDRGCSLRARNLLDMRRALEPLAHLPAVLRQDSPYDEMVGQSAPGAGNTLEIPLILRGVAGDVLH
jgi:Family of unknown function (DUF6482)